MNKMQKNAVLTLLIISIIIFSPTLLSENIISTSGVEGLDIHPLSAPYKTETHFISGVEDLDIHPLSQPIKDLEEV